MKLSSLFTTLWLRTLKAARRLFLRDRRVSPGVYQNLASLKFDSVVFYLNCPYATRLGDSLFFRSAFEALFLQGLPFFVYSHHGNHRLLSYLCPGRVKVLLGGQVSPKPSQLVISVIGNSTLKISNDFAYVILDPHRYSYSGTIADFYRDTIEGVCALVSLLRKKYSKDDYIFVSLDVGSQKFSLRSRAQADLISCARAISSTVGCSVVIFTEKNFNVGANETRLCPAKVDFNDFVEMLKNSICVFTFDSFVMHFAHMNDVTTFVRFRGKLFPSDYRGHFSHINNAMKGNVIYL